MTVSQLLVPVGGKDALEFLPKLIARRGKAGWQTEKMQVYLARLQKRLM